MKSLYQEDNLRLGGEHNCAVFGLNKSSLSTADHDFNHLFKHKETHVDVHTQHTHPTLSSFLPSEPHVKITIFMCLYVGAQGLPRSVSSLHQTSEPPASTSCLVLPFFSHQQ